MSRLTTGTNPFLIDMCLCRRAYYAAMAEGDDPKDPKPPKAGDGNGNGKDAGARPVDEGAQPHDEAVAPAEEHEKLYETHIGQLIGTARDDFGIEEGIAIGLAHDVMTVFIHASRRVSDIPGWLNGAISFASEAYVLREVVVPDWTRTSAAAPDLTLPNGVAWRDVADRLTPRFRRLLELRYVEGHTIAEMAEILGATQQYVEALLECCLRLAARRAVRPEGQ